MTVRNKYHYNGKVPPHGVDIQRGTPFGNKFRSSIYGKDECLRLYEEDLIIRVKSDPEFRELILSLSGKDLYCTCAPRKCHGDIIEKIIFKIQMGEL